MSLIVSETKRTRAHEHSMITMKPLAAWGREGREGRGRERGRRGEEGGKEQEEEEEGREREKVHDEGMIRNVFRELQKKNSSHPGLNWGL